jgi:DNA adenine methylase
MLEGREEGQFWVEPFVGGANMIDKVTGNRIGADFNEYLIALHESIQQGWTPPDYVSEDEWRDVKSEMDSKYPKHYIAFVRLGCSFGADWNGGFARNVKKDKPNAEELNRTTKSYCRQSKNNMLKQLGSLKDVVFLHSTYQDLLIPPNSIIYCDPPYEGTLGYKDEFNHKDFWQWCRDKRVEGHTVYVSEYNAPEDFLCVWEKEVTVNISSRGDRVERLFTLL